MLFYLYIASMLYTAPFLPFWEGSLWKILSNSFLSDYFSLMSGVLLINGLREADPLSLFSKGNYCCGEL